jgi:hypothetical protein
MAPLGKTMAKALQSKSQFEASEQVSRKKACRTHQARCECVSERKRERERERERKPLRSFMQREELDRKAGMESSRTTGRNIGRARENELDSWNAL